MNYTVKENNWKPTLICFSLVEFLCLYENPGKKIFKKYSDEIAFNMPTYKLSYFNNLSC